MKLEQAPRYQRDENVKAKRVTKEFTSIYRMLSMLPKKLKVLDIACAEGFLVYLAKKMKFELVDGIEIDKNRVARGKKHLNLILKTGDIFNKMDMLKEYDVFILSRFLHNVGEKKSKELISRINRQKNFILIVKYKPGMKRENDEPREPLATKKGLNEFFGKYNLAKKSFPQQVIVVAKGKYVSLLKLLRANIGEG